jgi:hypothetical protein
MKPKELIPYVKTRWGSWAAVFERLLELKDVRYIRFYFQLAITYL